MALNDEAKLEPGKFYWVQITLDPDREDWENEPMPARFVRYNEDNEPVWNFIGMEDESDWYVRWTGDEIKMSQ